MSDTKVITPADELVRFSYANVYVPTAMEEGQEKKHNVSIIVSKDNVKTIKMLKDAIDAAKEEGKPKWGGKIPKTFKNLALRDGDEHYPDDEAYENSYFMSAKSKTAPSIIDPNGHAITEESGEFYSGCYGRVSVVFFPYNSGGNKGVGVGLQNIMKVEDGDKLGGKSSANEDFGLEEDDLM